jgi:23S rRNA (adenine2503-C2)-methyltransferase
MTRQALRVYVAELGEQAYRGDQVMKWGYHRGAAGFADMTDLSKAFRERLEVLAEFRAPRVESVQQSSDGTRKWLLRLDDGNAIETVLIPEERRTTLCVSSQVGCALNCSFCATATQGFSRNLSVEEIVGQVWLAHHTLRKEDPDGPGITNVVLMGMGEPLLNFDNVVEAMNIMRDDMAFGLARRRVTLSTSGLVPGMDRLREVCDVSLAVSLHAPDDELRNQLVPVNRKYPIAELLGACRRYVAARPRARVTFEYTLMAGVNDSPEQARALARVLEGVPAKINLIPFNPYPGAIHRRPSLADMQSFADILHRAGYITTLRRTRGDDIDAACGQLVGRVQDRTRRQARYRASLEGKRPPA